MIPPTKPTASSEIGDKTKYDTQPVPADEPAIRSAYNAVADRTGFPDVPISEIAKEMGWLEKIA